MLQSNQRYSAPFMMSPLVDDFGYLALGPAASAVLEGSYIPPPGTDEYARKLFDQLKMHSRCTQRSQDR
jgi:hypothetical protein